MTKTIPIRKTPTKIWTGPVFVDGLGNRTAYIATRARANISSIFADYGIRLSTTAVDRLWKESHALTIRRILDARADRPFLLKPDGNPEVLANYDTIPIPLDIPNGNEFRPYWRLEITATTSQPLEALQLPEGWAVDLHRPVNGTVTLFRNVNGLFSKPEAIGMAGQSVQVVKGYGTDVAWMQISRVVFNGALVS